MGDDILIPVPSNTSEPLSQRWGLTGDYTLHIPLSTSVSESGIGHTPALNLHIAESFDDRYILRLQFPFSSTDSHIMATTDDAGTTKEHSTRGAMAGFGHAARRYSNFGEEGDFNAALTVATVPMVGRISSTLTRQPRNVVGKDFGSATESESAWEIGTRYTFTGEFRPGGGRGPVLEIGPGFYYGVQYAGENSQHNRLNLAFLITAGAGYGDGSTTSGADADTELGPMGILYGLYSMGHGWAQRYMMDKSLSAPMQSLNEYGLIGSSDSQPDSTTDVKLLKAGGSFSSGMGSPLAAPLRAGTGWFAALTVVRVIGGGAFASSGSAETSGSGIADLVSSGRLIGYAMAGIEEPDKRLSLSSDDVEKREMYVALPIYIIGALMVPMGAAADNEALMRGGSNANIQLALSPDPLDRGMVERTDIGFIPTSLYYGTKDGSRGGILVHSSWHNVPSEEFQLYSAATLISPMLKPGNLANMPGQDSPYSDASLNSDVCASLGFEYKPTWVRLSFGPKTCGIFGSGDAAPKAGIGGTAGFDVTIPLNGRDDGSGPAFGVRADAIKLLPEGSQYEIQPWLGISLHE